MQSGTFPNVSRSLGKIIKENQDQILVISKILSRHKDSGSQNDLTGRLLWKNKRSSKCPILYLPPKR